MRVAALLISISVLCVLVFIFFRVPHRPSRLLCVPSRIYPLFCCWPGSDPLPEWVRICLDVCKLKCGETFDVQLIDLPRAEEVLDIPEAFYYLRYAHRADFLRIQLLKKFGGAYFDIDTVFNRDVGYLLCSGSDIVTAGPSRREDLHPAGNIVRFESLIVLDPAAPLITICAQRQLQFLRDNYDRLKRANPTRDPRKDGLQWSEMLYEIVKMDTLPEEARMVEHVDNFSHEFGTEIVSDSCVDDSRFYIPDVIVLNNSMYGERFRNLSRQEFLALDVPLARILKAHLGHNVR